MPSLQRRFKKYTAEERREYIKKKYENLSEVKAREKSLNLNCIEIGKRVRKLRIAAGISQRELGIRLKTYQSSISRIEAGIENIQINNLEKIAKVFNKKIKIILY